MAEIESGQTHATFWDVAVKAHGKRTSIVPLDSVELCGLERRFVGSIHHITRCGSTTLLQQFGALDRVFGLSEPFIFLQLLGRNSADPDLAKRRVQRLAALFGRGLAPLADHIVVKWPTLLCRHAQLLHAALPELQSVFLVRNAVEILASIEREPLGGMDGLAAELLCGPGETADGINASDKLAVTARMLAANCRWIVKSRPTRLVTYEALPAVGWEKVAPAFGMALAPEQIAQMAVQAGVNAKRSDTRFLTDSTEKQRLASPQVRSLAQDILQPAIDDACAAMRSIDDND